MPEGFVFGPSPSYMNLEGILASAEAEVAHPLVRVTTGPRVDFDDTLKKVFERARGYRAAFPPERVPTGNHAYPIGPSPLIVYWGPLGQDGWHSGQCQLCDVEWSAVSRTNPPRAICWCCGRFQDRPRG